MVQKNIMTKTLSVLISAYDEHEITVAHIRECMNSTRVPDEIIVVNDGGTPDLKEKLLKLKCPIIYAQINENIKWNYTGARNLGIWLSKGDFIAIEDNDHIPEKHFYELALKEFENPEIMRVKCAKRWVVNKADVISKPIDEWEIVSSRPAHDDTAIIRREVALRVKGFDERLAGEYGWSSTRWRRQLNKIGFLNKTTSAGNYYVRGDELSRKETPGKALSYRNYSLAKTEGFQSLAGILNFSFEYEQLRN